MLFSIITALDVDAALRQYTEIQLRNITGYILPNELAETLFVSSHALYYCAVNSTA